MLDGLLTGPDPDLESIGAAEALRMLRVNTVTPVVIDASAGAEIVADTRRARALAGLLPVEAVGVPEHFYAEVFGVVHRHTLIEKACSRWPAPVLATAQDLGPTPTGRRVRIPGQYGCSRCPHCCAGRTTRR